MDNNLESVSDAALSAIPPTLDRPCCRNVAELLKRNEFRRWLMGAAKGLASSAHGVLQAPRSARDDNSQKVTIVEGVARAPLRT